MADVYHLGVVKKSLWPWSYKYLSVSFWYWSIDWPFSIRVLKINLEIVIVKWSIWAWELESLWVNFTDLINRENKPCVINECYNYIYLRNVLEGLTSEAFEFLPFLPLVHPPKENNVLFCDELIPSLEWGVTQLDVPLNSWACAGFSTWENHRHVRKYNN